jgi:hypothetical protein
LLVLTAPPGLVRSSISLVSFSILAALSQRGALLIENMSRALNTHRADRFS